MNAPVRAEKPNFRTPWLESDIAVIAPYWQRIMNYQVDIINAQQARIESLETAVAALQQYNIDHP